MHYLTSCLKTRECLHNIDLDQQGLMGIASHFESLESLIHEKMSEKVEGF